MKKSSLLFLVLCFFGFLISVHAENIPDNYYYQTEDNTYMLCTSSSPNDCIEIEPGADGASFSSNRIIYGGVIYIRYQEYEETITGSSKMFYYVDKDGKYQLCETDKNCKSYSFQELLDELATVISRDRVILNNGEGPGNPGDVYYFNSEYQDRVDKGENLKIPAKEEIPPVTDNCQKLKEPLKFIGNVVLIFKILIPFIIIIFGIVDFFKAIVGSKEDDIKKSARSLMMRAVSGVIIFLIPTIISVIFSLISDFVSIKGDFNACQKCVFRVTECK